MIVSVHFFFVSKKCWFQSLYIPFELLCKEINEFDIQEKTFFFLSCRTNYWSVLRSFSYLFFFFCFIQFKFHNSNATNINCNLSEVKLRNIKWNTIYKESKGKVINLISLIQRELKELYVRLFMNFVHVKPFNVTYS